MNIDINKIISLLNDLSSFISFQMSKQHSLEHIDLTLNEIIKLFDGDYGFIGFDIKTRDKGSEIFQRAIGIPKEQCANINKAIESELNKIENSFQPKNIYHVDLLSGERVIDALRGLKTIIFTPILSSDINNGTICIYSRKHLEVNADEIDFLSTVGGLITNTFIARRAYDEALGYIDDKRQYFEKLYNSVLVLDRDLNILNGNEAGYELLGNINLNNETKPNISDFISHKDLNSISGILKDLKIGELSKEVSIKWNMDPNSSDKTNSVKVIFGFTKFKNFKKQIIYLASGRIIHLSEILALRSKSNVDFNLLSRLSEIQKEYFIDANSVIPIIKKELFPTSVVFIVNEESGPQPLVSSPEMELLDLMGETISLMAGLNTNEIINQVYITGSTPWTVPHGELKWIAFTRSNPNARGNTEFHLIGILVARNLINVTPQLNQLLFGILLGGMNDYLSILDDDRADFTTKLFNGDRNFSTISLIRKTLDELRDFASELFAATLPGLESSF